MKLIIGGYAQGKLSYVMEKYSVRSSQVWEAKLPQKNERDEGSVVINHFHNWIKGRIADAGRPEEEILRFIQENPECIIISDEIGNGIVPIDAFEREYRERTGRILIELAKNAEGVERIICGISQRIK